MREISRELMWLRELSRVSEEFGSNEPGGIVDNTGEIGEADNTGGASNTYDAGDTCEIGDSKGRTVESGEVDVSFSCVVKTQKRWSNKIYKTELTKI